MKITFIGTSSCIPDVGSEAASLVINGRHLVDTGWCAPLKMRQFGLNPLDLDSVFLTHLHQDHYIGLASLLFYIGLQGSGRTDHQLYIAGPGSHLNEVVRAAFDFIQLSRFPELQVEYTLIPLKPEQHAELGGLRIDTFAVRHTSGKNVVEDALSYRVTEVNTGIQFAYSGDTSYHPSLANFVRGVPLLIHDAAHTSARDAATIARMAEASRLLLIHFSQENAAALLAEARSVFSETYLSRDGEVVIL